MDMIDTKKTTSNGVKAKIIQVVGWYGVVAIVVAYALNSFSIIPSGGAFIRYLISLAH